MFVFHGILGALLHVLVHAEKPSDLKEFTNIRNILVGGIAGYIYYVMHTSYNLPDSAVAIVFGYFARDLIEATFERIKDKLYKVLE